MKQSIHLAIVTPFPPATTGVGQYAYHVSGALARSDVFERITLLTEVAPDTQPVEDRRRLRVERLWQPDELGASWRIVSRLRQLKPHLVWFNLRASMFGRSPLANMSGLLSPMLCWMADLPCVVTVHEMTEHGWSVS
jgi:hypothetical protein